MPQKGPQKGSHTWDLVLQYHQCPHCGWIIESREDYHYRLGHDVKDLVCSKCHHQFTLIKTRKPRFGPLFGTAEVAEWDWPENDIKSK